MWIYRVSPCLKKEERVEGHSPHNKDDPYVSEGPESEDKASEL